MALYGLYGSYSISINCTRCYDDQILLEEIMDEQEPYYIRKGDMMLYGISAGMRPVWTIDLEEAQWFEQEEARQWCSFLQTTFNLSGLEIHQV